MLDISSRFRKFSLGLIDFRVTDLGTPEFHFSIALLSPCCGKLPLFSGIYWTCDHCHKKLTQLEGPWIEWELFEQDNQVILRPGDEMIALLEKWASFNWPSHFEALINAQEVYGQISYFIEELRTNSSA